MNTKLKFLTLKLATILYCMQSSANSSHLVGNGGDIVVCKTTTGKFKSAELLDFYEARIQRKFELIEPKAHSSEKEIAEEMIERLSIYGTNLSDMLKDFNEHFKKDANFLSGIDLNDADDSFHLFLPKDCSLEQVIIQREPLFAGDARYTVSADLWDLLDPFNKAGLILHEIVYRVLISSPFPPETLHSKDVRFITGVVAANKVKEIYTIDEFIHFIREKLGFLCPSVKKNRSNTQFQCEESPEKTKKTLGKAHLIRSKWLGADDSVEPRRTVEVFFKDEKTMLVTETCHFKKIDAADTVSDLSVTLKVPVRITDSEIHYLKDVAKTERNHKYRTFCTAFFRIGFGAYLFINSNTLAIFDGLVLNRVD